MIQGLKLALVPQTYFNQFQYLKNTITLAGSEIYHPKNTVFPNRTLFKK